MRFNRTCIESIGFSVPDEIWSSSEIEERLQPLYKRLRLPEGRLELMTGIRERRVWPSGMLPSEKSITSGQLAIESAGVPTSEIGMLVHASVCRDHLEPATACRVHHALGLPQESMIYDTSNACLGLINGMLQIACMIELGQIKAGIVVGTEDSRHLLETTIKTLNNDQTLTRSSIKMAVASLTIGSASCAILLTDRSISNTGNRLVASACRANTVHHELCHSGRDEAVASGMQPIMETDSEQLMKEGVVTGVATLETFLDETEWSREDFNKTICHQVGAAHRKLMLESLGLPLERDFPTMQWLGNTGSVALPVTLGVACQQEQVQANDNVALLGIGSGINCVMVGVNWQRSLVKFTGPIPNDAHSVSA